MDSSLLTLLFAIYVGVMIYNAKMSMESEDKILDNKTNKTDQLVIRNESTPLLNDKTVIMLEHMAANCKDSSNYGHYTKAKSGYEEIITKKLIQIEEDDIESSLMNNCFISLILSPVYILFYITLPKSWPVFTFVGSIVWLSGLSYATVWAISGFSN